MTSKKILVVSASFYPELSPRSFRTTELVKELARQGHQVTLYTLKNAALHETMAKELNITIKDLGKLHYPRINVNHSNKLISLIKRVLSRSLLMLFEYPDVELMFKVKRSLAGEKGYDLLVSVAVPFPVHWGVAGALSKNKLLANTWVADCGDPYMGNKADSFKKLFYFSFIEKWFCRKADFITVPTEGSKEGYYKEFHSKLRVIPQGFNFSDVNLYQGVIKNEVPTFAYAGSFEPGIRDPRELLDFLMSYKNGYKFIIYTNNKALVKPYVSIAGNKIELRDYIPRKELLYELSKMDFLVNFNYGSNVQSPSKLIDYTLTARPILSINPGKIDTLMVSDFLNKNYSGKIVISDFEQYDIKNIAEKFVQLCN